MACCKSMLARRIVLWYILLGTFVIFPISLSVGLGCRFIDVRVDTDHGFQSFGPFNVAIYDPEARGSSHFLGCVDMSLYWEEETSDDIGFMALRISSAFMLGFVSLATLICVCIQCFSKHGKSHLWSLMRFCYIGATMSQGFMYYIFASDMCSPESTEVTDDYGDDNHYDTPQHDNHDDTPPQCTPGSTGIIGVFNFALLCGMVIATFVSLPPRNPVFQCWQGDSDYTDESEDGSTSEEDSVMRKFKSLGAEDNDSVSLFGGSRVSRKSRKSTKSGKDLDDTASTVEKGLSKASVESGKNGRMAVVSENPSVASSEKRMSNEKAKSNEIVVETVESGSVSTAKSNRSKKSAILPLVANIFNKTKSNDEHESVASERDNAGSVSMKKSVEEKESFKKSVEEIASLASKKSSRSVKSLTSKKSNKSAKSHGSRGSLLKSDTHDVKSAGTLSDYGLKSTWSSASGSTLEVTNFVIQLIEMTELGEGGRRVKLADNENQVEIVDEYPLEAGGEIEATSSSDQIAVRTEYYDLGERSTKEITHRDGSKTVVTKITVDISSSDSTTDEKPRKNLEPPVELSRSAGSIESAQSSKYQVMKSDSSATSAVRNKTQLRQGDLCLSVATSNK